MAVVYKYLEKPSMYQHDQWLIIKHSSFIFQGGEGNQLRPLQAFHHPNSISK